MAPQRPLLVLAAVLALLGPRAAPAAPPRAAVAALQQLFDREWEQDLRDNPLAATY